MNTSEPPSAVETSLTQDLIHATRYYLGGRRGLILLTVAALGVGAALNWSWLVAIGVAPLLLAFAPCAAMCALGLCMSKATGNSCSTDSESTGQSQLRAGPEQETTDGSDVVEGVSAEVTAVSNRAKQSETMNERNN